MNKKPNNTPEEQNKIKNLIQLLKELELAFNLSTCLSKDQVIAIERQISQIVNTNQAKSYI